MKIVYTDCLVIGSGISGMMAAECLSPYKKVVLLTKGAWHESNSILAQGGIASTIDEGDQWTDHFFDTIRAGDGHNVHDIVQLLVQSGPEMIERLIRLGVCFDKDEHGHFLLATEGCHTKRRILHAGGDATGREIVTRLYQRVKNHVTIIEHETVVDLLTKDGVCYGAWTVDHRGLKHGYFAHHTILATGGVGRLYSTTSNHAHACGDGIAIAYRAGAKLADLEFMQFHPTLLVKNGTCFGLVSEAVRGEGATIVTKSGKRVMEGIHPLKDLAPRDVVARAIDKEWMNGESVFLNVKPVRSFERRFPTIAALCAEHGISLSDGLIPVCPGAHFLMGGVVTDSYARTTIKHLYAVGEVANTGAHGANRLASNSLLEAVVFAKRAAQSILKENDLIQTITNEPQICLPVNMPNIADIQSIMDHHVGIVRDGMGLAEAVDWFEQRLKNQRKVKEVSREACTIRNMIMVGWLMAKSAFMRTESRGSHYRKDYPKKDDRRWLKKKIVHDNVKSNAILSTQ